MTSYYDPKDAAEAELLGTILNDDKSEDAFQARMTIGKSISAPPLELKTPSPDLFHNTQEDVTATEGYYRYYHSIGSQNGQLPYPKWQQGPGRGSFETVIDQFNERFGIDEEIKEKETNLQGAGPRSKRPACSRPNQGAKNFAGPNEYKIGNSDFRKDQTSFPSHGNKADQHQSLSHRSAGSLPTQAGPQFFQRQVRSERKLGSKLQRGQPEFIAGKNVCGPNLNYMPQNSFGEVPYDLQHQNHYTSEPYVQQFEGYQIPASKNENHRHQANFFGKNTTASLNSNYELAYKNQIQYANIPDQIGCFSQFLGVENQYVNAKPFRVNSTPGLMNSCPQNASPNYMSNILKNFVESSKDQMKSRSIQQYIEKADQEEKSTIYQAMLPDALNLMQDAFGNYVVQKFFDHGTLQQKIQLYEVMRGRIFELSCHTYGYRVVQKIIEEFKNNIAIYDEILAEIGTDTLYIIEDNNGNHVIRKCLETLPPQKLEFIVREVNKNVGRLCFHAYGSKVIHSILEHLSYDQNGPILEKILQKAVQCCQCQYGNYIIQYIISNGPEAERDLLLNVIRQNFIKFSVNKFASNVTEKSVICGGAQFRDEVVSVLTTTYPQKKIGLVTLMNHNYGNYVVQKLFECSNDKTRKRLYGVVIRPENIMDLMNNSHGRHVLAFVERLVQSQQGAAKV